MQSVGPNEHCPCGSGRKYKKCHGRPAGKQGLGWLPVITGLLILVGAASAYFMLKDKKPVATPSGSATGAPTRLGQAWEYDAASNTHFDPSPGHNHWHQGPPPQGKALGSP